MLKIITLLSFIAMAVNSLTAKQHTLNSANFQFLLAMVFIVSFCLLARRMYEDFEIA